MARRPWEDDVPASSPSGSARPWEDPCTAYARDEQEDSSDEEGSRSPAEQLIEYCVSLLLAR